MKKRLIALTLLIAMLVSVSPSVVADDTEQQPTVEEILSEYHQKAFEAEVAEQSGGASTYSRSAGNSGKTLEEETVDALNAAGYEAYNVTSDNYETLETQLQTDFADMGLDPDCSYIITISGEEDSPSNNSRVRDDLFNPALPPDVGGDGSQFAYIYNGVSYLMRYVTVTSDANPSGMQVQSNCILQPQYWLENTVRNIINTALVGAVDTVSPKYLPFGTIASLISDSITDQNYTEVDPGSITVIAQTSWTYQFIQVWNSYDETWDTAQCSEHTTTLAKCVGVVYDSDLDKPVSIMGEDHYITYYSPLYHDDEKRRLATMKAYDAYEIVYDCIFEVNFYLGSEEGDIIFSSEDEPIFTHKRSNTTTLPD